MNLRAFFIVKRAALAGDPVLDLKVILDWFRESLPMSLADATLGIRKCNEAMPKSSAARPEELQICRELRWIKNKLRVIRLLTEGGALVPDEHLSSWLKLRDSLP